MANDPLYLFCFARTGRVPELQGPGLDQDSPLFMRSFTGAAAVLSNVPLEQFCGPSGDEHVADLAWLAPRACRHVEIVGQIMEHSPVLPARMGTLFSSESKLEDFVTRHEKEILRFLDRMTGHSEWSMKGLLDVSKAGEACIAEALARHAGTLAALTAGKRYLEEQKVRAEAAQAGNNFIAETCRALAADLRGLASDFAERRIVIEDAEPGRETIFNWAFLVAANELERFQSKAQELNAAHSEQGLELKITGPWPPYSFAPALQD